MLKELKRIRPQILVVAFSGLASVQSTTSKRAIQLFVVRVEVVHKVSPDRGLTHMPV